LAMGESYEDDVRDVELQQGTDYLQK
jgi:hypothetical protein